MSFNVNVAILRMRNETVWIKKYKTNKKKLLI